MPVLEKPANTLTAVDWFTAKLRYEATPYGLKADLDKKAPVLVLDVRDRESFAKEHIAGAKNIPLADLPKELSTLPKDKTIVTYCWTLTCALAPKAALELAKNGFTTQELVGGIALWKEKGFPVETSAK